MQVHPMAVLDRAMQAGGQVPRLHEPAACRGMVELQALFLMRREGGVIVLHRFGAAVQVGDRLIERQHPDILQQRSEEDFFRHRLTQRIGQGARSRRGDQCAPPVPGIVDPVRLAAA